MLITNILKSDFLVKKTFSIFYSFVMEEYHKSNMKILIFLNINVEYIVKFDYFYIFTDFSNFDFIFW